MNHTLDYDFCGDSTTDYRVGRKIKSQHMAAEATYGNKIPETLRSQLVFR